MGFPVGENLPDKRHVHRQLRPPGGGYIKQISHHPWEFPMIGRSTITPEQAEELQALNTEYFDATRQAAEALRTGGGPLVGAALQTVLEADKRAGDAMLLIKAIHGI